MFSIVAAPIFNPTNSVEGFSFLQSQERFLFKYIQIDTHTLDIENIQELNISIHGDSTVNLPTCYTSTLSQPLLSIFSSLIKQRCIAFQAFVLLYLPPERFFLPLANPMYSSGLDFSIIFKESIS